MFQDFLCTFAAILKTPFDQPLKTTNMVLQLQFSDIPHDWAICVQHDCPLAGSCLRHHAGTLAPDDLKHRDCVLPGARSADGCALFVEDQPVRLAHGMKGLLAGVSYKDVHALHKHLYGIFGSTSQYYRYRDGRWPISPRQQERVAALFRKFGFKGEPRFDSYSEGYYFGPGK